MKVLVTGGRDFLNFNKLVIALDEVHRLTPITLVIHGAARGADTFAHAWAYLRGIPELPFKADWKASKRGAGPIRNRKMLKESQPDLVVAFPGGTGTADMVTIAKAANVPVVEIE